MAMLLRSQRVLRLPTLAPALGSALLAAGVWRFLRRVEVEGDSMRPTLQPGDRLLVVRGRRARPGQLVVVADPRQPRRRMLKRVVSADHGGVTVAGDNPLHSTDSRVFGPVEAVEGRAVYRYHPPERAGTVR